jgi:DNA-binding CsgD family transcriptional regulator
VAAKIMVGREAEMERLRAAMELATSGTPTVVLVQGEAGVGKSRLVAEWSAQSEGAGLLLTGRCFEVAGAELAFAPFAAALQDLVRQLGLPVVREIAGPATASLATLVPSLGGDADGDRRTTQASLFHAVGVLLRGLADREPVRLLIEDIHWADSATRDLLAYLTHTLTDEPVLIVMTMRDQADWPPELAPFVAELLRLSNVHQVILDSLSATEVSAQASDILGRPLEAEYLEKLVTLSDGLPFLVEELLASVPLDRNHVPDRPRQIVLARLAGLSGEVRRLIDAASLADAELTDNLLRAVLEGTAVHPNEALRTATAAGVLVVDPDRTGYRFRHALVRAAVADALLPGERQAWHRRWAEAIQAAPDELDRLQAMISIAHHWMRAGDAELALRSAFAAAGACQSSSAYAEQTMMLCRALELWDRVPEAEALVGTSRKRLVDDIEAACVIASMWDRRETTLLAELEREEVQTDPLRATLLQLGLAASREWQGRPQPFVDVDSAVDLARTAPVSRDKVRALLELCWVLASTEPARAATLMADAITAAEAVADPHLVLAARVDRTFQLLFAGDHQAALDATRELVPHLEEMDPLRAMLVQQALASLLSIDGQLQEAVDVAANMRRGATPWTAPQAWAQIAYAAAFSLVGLGRWAEADNVLQEARERTVHVPFSQGWLDSLRGLLAVWRGDVDWAAQLASTIDSMEGAVATSWDVAAWLRAEVAASTGQGVDVRQLLEPIWTKPDLRAHSDIIPWILMVAARAEADFAALARAMRDQQQLDQSRDATSVLRRVADSIDYPGPLGRALAAHLDAELSRWASANPEPWQAALEAWRPVGFPHEQGWALLHLAEGLVELGDRDGAAAALSEAAALAEPLGAQPLLRELQALARRARLPVENPKRDALTGDVAPTAPAHSLTARELEVLELLIEGYSNPEIAKRLFMSPKTASVHVSRILGKLGATNRTQAATIGHRLGLSRPA